jgi:hypothetical protein
MLANMGYRLGIDVGTTFTAAALERNGGHVAASLGEAMAQLNPEDIRVQASVARLREDCIQANTIGLHVQKAVVGQFVGSFAIPDGGCLSDVILDGTGTGRINVEIHVKTGACVGGNRIVQPAGGHAAVCRRGRRRHPGSRDHDPGLNGRVNRRSSAGVSAG